MGGFSDSEEENTGDGEIISSQEFKTIGRDVAEGVQEVDEEVEGDEPDRLSQLPDSVRETVSSLFK